ncbi:MAG TPA: DeoR/GlpR family DNA-binding transcription regulator [Chloroflexaceae bacterium]|nr:DeoR/GlpR family DNA-binding transcription regulator [Chloroflexaceae bacterium]
MLKPLERRQQIVKDIDGLDDNIIPRLSRKYGVSEMTIRRDLKVLEELGLIKRTYGGAVRWPSAAAEPVLVARERRQTLSHPQKVQIARRAAELVDHGDIIILEGGTTATAMAPFLADREDLTVVTNGLATCEELRRHLPLGATIICTGGILRPESATFVGPVAEEFFSQFYARRLFISASGLTAQDGLTDPKMLEIQVKRAMIAAAAEVVALVDGSKFGVRSLMKVADFAELRALITDDQAPAATVEALRERGLPVHVAQAIAA